MTVTIISLVIDAVGLAFATWTLAVCVDSLRWARWMRAELAVWQTNPKERGHDGSA